MSAASLCSVGAVASLGVAYLLLNQEEEIEDVHPTRRLSCLIRQTVARILLLVTAGCIVGVWLAK